MIDPSFTHMSISQQCDLMGLPQAIWSLYSAVPIDNEKLALINTIDRQYTQRPFRLS